ncbi:hypothetical protein J7T55_013085 [Diaporthe amygdali]|uniref:uncharacterized protein n=1 Tax=Phomopsis amygdali TaxID=1214568 RepID=UPI0022FE993B|nr:uncharacterized protein J7T55_013085 [Diaporthe amygdali]KAJ0118830.1 hypothetical protein J7T55_013085 [Diaporthe amygdali]
MATVIIVGVLATLFLYGLYQWLLPKPLPDIPYNNASAKNIFGDIPELVKEVSKTGDFADYIRKQSRKHNSPITQLFMTPFGKPSLLVCDFREAQDVLLHRGKEFDRSRFVGELFYGTGKNHHITMKTGPEWKARRKLLQDLMSPSFLHNVAAPTVYASSLNILKLWELKADLADGRPFLASKDIFHAALDAVLAFTFGIGFKEDATTRQIQLMQSLERGKIAAGGADVPVKFPTATLGTAISSILFLTASVERVRGAASMRLKWWFIQKETGFKKAQKDKDEAIHGEIEKAIQARRKNGQGGNDAWVQSAVDHMVDREVRVAEKEGRQSNPHSPDMLEEILGFIIAGHDTTSTTLCWGVKLLADHPGVQQRVRDDMQAAFPEAKAEGRLPSVTEITKVSIPYLEATMEEILRVGNTVPITDRDAVQDTTLLGHFVPKGTQVFFLANGPSFLEPAFDIEESRRSPHAREGKARVWESEDIGAFKPERWLTEENGREVFDSQAGPDMPFGLGTRGCYGRRLAYLELRLLLTVFLWKFEFQKCPAELSRYDAVDGVVHGPKDCYVRLRKVAA